MKIKFTNTEKPEKIFDCLEITIGREVDNMLQLESEGVSRHHGRIYCENGSYFIEDLGSTNGIKVNGTKITAPVKLQENDLLDFHKEQIQISGITTSTAEPATVILSPSDTAKISISEVITDNSDSSIAIDPVIITPVADKINTVTLTPTEEKAPEPAKDQDFDKIAEFIQQNTGNLFNAVRAKTTSAGKQNNEDNQQNT